MESVRESKNESSVVANASATVVSDVSGPYGNSSPVSRHWMVCVFRDSDEDQRGLLTSRITFTISGSPGCRNMSFA